MDTINLTQENSFDIRGILPELHKLYLKYNDFLSEILKVDSGIEEGKAIEYAIAIIPQFLFEVYGILCPDKCMNKSENWHYRDYFCFCINYNSHLYPNNRFHLHLSDGTELKTFCYKKRDGAEQGSGLEIDSISKLYDKDSNLYDIDSIFVVLLDLFYNHLGEFRNEFSMNKFLSLIKDTGGLVNLANRGTQQTSDNDFNKSWYYVLKDENYTEGTPISGIEAVVKYLDNRTYGYISPDGGEINYTNYAAFLMVAAGLRDQRLPKDYQDWEKEYALKWEKKRRDSTPSGQTSPVFRQYNIPILGFDENRTATQESRKVIGNLMIPSLVEIDEYVLSFFYVITDDLLNKIWQFEKIVWARKAAVRAAIAQVMARNMSHNFGSHVLSNLISDKVYENLRDAAVQSELKMFKSFALENDLFKENENHQLQYFFQYLKSRMDYLSEITLGISNLLSTKMINNDVVKELDRVRILLNYISGVSNFEYEFKIEYDSDTDIGVAFPNDVLGCQAFYNIIENIIRNTAKHAKRKEEANKTVVFTIHFKDIIGCDDIEGADELYCVEIDNGVPEENINKLVTDQNERLNESVLEHDRLRSRNLGLLEMEASAAFLRQIDLPEIESDDYHVDNSDNYYYKRNGKKRLNILKAFNKNGALGYRFFMQKAKEFLFVVDWEVNETIIKRLLRIGIQFITSDDFILAMQNGESFAHHFLLYQNSINKVEFQDYLNDKDYKTLLPLRQLPLNEKDWKDISGYWTPQEQQPSNLNFKDAFQALKDWAWQKLWQEDTVNISISGALNSSKHQVVFLDHGSTFDETKNKVKTKISKGEIVEAWVENMTSKTYGKLPRYSEIASKGNDKPFTNYIDNLFEEEGLRIELLEAYHNKIIVIDERVQRFAEKNNENGISCMMLFESTNVCCPRLSDIPLDPTDFVTDHLNTAVEDFIDRSLNKDTFLLIHYGILERMYSGDGALIKDNLISWADIAKRVIVTSGRGAHSLDLPPSVCFANLSSVLYAFNENRNKYVINYLLNQSRRKRNE